MGKAESGRRIAGVVDLFIKNNSDHRNLFQFPQLSSSHFTSEDTTVLLMSYCVLQKHWDSLYTL